MSKEFSFVKEFSVQDEDLKAKLLFPFQHAQKAFKKQMFYEGSSTRNYWDACIFEMRRLKHTEEKVFLLSFQLIIVIETYLQAGIFLSHFFGGILHGLEK